MRKKSMNRTQTLANNNNYMIMIFNEIIRVVFHIYNGEIRKAF